MPRGSPIGFIIAFFAVLTGFSLIWQIWWLVILGLLAILATVLVFGWSENREREISAGEMARSSGRGCVRERGMTIASDRCGSPRAGVGAGGEDRPPRRRGLLRLLDLPPLGLHHVFGAVCRLRGACRGGPPVVRPDPGCSLFTTSSSRPLFLLFSSYTCGLGAMLAEPLQRELLSAFVAFIFLFGAGFSSSGTRQFLSMVRQGAGPSAAPSFRPFSLWWACTARM